MSASPSSDRSPSLVDSGSSVVPSRHAYTSPSPLDAANTQASDHLQCIIVNRYFGPTHFNGRTSSIIHFDTGGTHFDGHPTAKIYLDAGRVHLPLLPSLRLDGDFATLRVIEYHLLALLGYNHPPLVRFRLYIIGQLVWIAPPAA